MIDRHGSDRGNDVVRPVETSILEMVFEKIEQKKPRNKEITTGSRLGYRINSNGWQISKYFL